jgi:3-polyprenyl-4-hydroxybenzoate decarboxylase
MTDPCPVALELEVAKAMRKSAAISGPAIRFNKNGTPFPLVGGVCNSRAKALTSTESPAVSREPPGC